MGRPRIIITCPDTGIAVISRIAYEDMINPLKAPMNFQCPCGETHKLVFAGMHGQRKSAGPASPTPQAI